jgi:ABC-type transport system substrate-binding protein
VRGTSALNYTLTVANVAPLPTVATELAAQLAQIGISVHVQQVPAAKIVAPDVTQHDFELALGDWDNGPDPDVSAFWRSNATPPDGVNVSGAPPDPFLDQALDILASATDEQARIAAAASVSHDLAVDAPAVFLYTPVDSFVVHSSLAATPVPTAGGSSARFADVTSWHH